MEFEGEFETHITIRAGSAEGVEALREWADGRGLKFHHIVLDRGRTPSQPMISRRGDGGLSGELAASAELARVLASDGFAVSRVKIEAAPGNRDVPASDEEAASLHRGRYFEHHVKLSLPSDADLSALAGRVGAHSAHLSRNALRDRPDGLGERFVTQRCHSVGRPTARRRLAELVSTLESGGYAILGVEAEFVVLDSEPGVDAGWLDLGG